MEPIEAVGPVDGRYRKTTEPLAAFFSEKALFSYRIRMEGEYLIALYEAPQLGLRQLSEQEKTLIRSLHSLSTEDALKVKAIEKKTNHDVKAVEYYMRERLKGTTLEDCVEMVHFGLTSEDVNNISYGMMLSDGIAHFVLPALDELCTGIESLAEQYSGVPMLARTHGQPASPTTFGKEFRVFSHRLRGQIGQLEKYEIAVKLNGATGNYNAHYIAYPDVDWIGFTNVFVEGLNQGRQVLRLRPNFVTTQIEPHDTYAELFDILRRANTILIDFGQDVWRYISDDWIKQKPVEGEVGSSTMPHKVNPIDFENAEGNFGVANALFEFFSRKLPVSRLQRDLSDSTVERNFGVALAHSLIGYKALLKGLSKTQVNEEKVREELERHPEVIAEALQTVLRREGVPGAYEKLKELSRGKQMTMEGIKGFINGLNISDELKQKLRGITPSTYTGLAQLLAVRPEK